MNLDAAMAAFREQERWLLGLIQDPTGSYYFEPRTPAEQLQRFQERMVRLRDFLAFAGNPEAQYHSVHVAGTSGKGSVVVMIANLLSQVGQVTGHHVTPYLQLCNEKLIIDGQWIGLHEFVEAVQALRQIYADWLASGTPFDRLTYGEAWVSLTYLWLAQREVDWAVIETGMGGRYDATNVLPSDLAVITNVSFDHIRSLGPTLADIAHHKAGIIKHKVPVVTTATYPTAQAVIRREAEEKEAPLYLLHEDFSFVLRELHHTGSVIDVHTPYHTYAGIRVPFAGNFQASNATAAIVAVDLLSHQYGYPFSTEIIQRALDGTTFGGRMEIMQREPLVILDGAHNPHKMQAVVESVKAVYAGKEVIVLVGTLSIKDAVTMMESLATIATQFIVTQPYAYGKPALPAAELAGKLKKIAPHIPQQTFPRVQDALAHVIPTLQSDQLLLITGSLYLVGEARNYWHPTDQLLADLL